MVIGTIIVKNVVMNGMKEAKMMKCEHCPGELKEERTKPGIYTCQICHCVYRFVIVYNDPKCYAKRFPTKSLK